MFLESENTPVTLDFLVEHEEYICILEHTVQKVRQSNRATEHVTSRHVSHLGQNFHFHFHFTCIFILFQARAKKLFYKYIHPRAWLPLPVSQEAR